MKILVLVHDLLMEKSHLMPWRTVCEIVLCTREAGHTVNLVSLGNRSSSLHGGLIPEGTKEINKNPRELWKNLRHEIRTNKPDVIFFPVSWRDSKKRIKLLADLETPVVLWFPGGVYSFRACMLALRRLGLRATLPYMLEILSSKRKMVTLFKDAGIKSILSMTQETADRAIAAGWCKTDSFVVPPGKENEHPSLRIAPLSTEFRTWLGHRDFYLYAGPPSGIRGIFELLKAFDMAAESCQEITLVCLFRADAVLDSHKVKRTIDRSKNKERIYSLWESLTPEELNGFMASCHAVVMPFILVPSEIPLAIIEAMGWGKPVISTSPGGTGAFVKEFGLAPKVGDIAGLAKALVDLHVNKELYEKKCLDTVSAYSQHPDWKQVCYQWLDVAQKVTTADDKDI